MRRIITAKTGWWRMAGLSATVEILAGIVRAGADHHVYGDRYDFAVAFSSIDGKTAIIKGLVSPDKTMTVRYVRAAVRALKDKGFEYVTWERKK